jgi:hypothetical protein
MIHDGFMLLPSTTKNADPFLQAALHISLMIACSNDQHLYTTKNPAFAGFFL